jgi:DNA-binding NtrC family response regulator
MLDRKKILIVDDEPNAVRVLSVILKEEGYHVLEAMDVDSAIGIVQNEDVDAIITDLKMPGKDGYQLFKYASERHPDIPVLFLTAFGNVESAVTAMRGGAYYYFIKPPDYSKLKNVLARALDQYAMNKEFENLKKRAGRENNVYPLIGKDPSMAGIVKTVASVKDSDSSVLIQGETGTGKEIVACNLHYSGKRYNKPFVAVNCAAIPRELMESELFGFDKGAFTGAATNKAGKFETAAEGTIFLDEIGELDLTVQAKLLRVLQEREVERLGSNSKVKVNFMLISSTNRDLRKEVDEGRFREDLYYRINVIQINVPPLRDRRQDIPLLAAEFLNGFSVRANKPFVLSAEVMDSFMSSEWPGNVRQLKNVIERAVVLAKGERITARELPEEFLKTCRQTTEVEAGAVKPLKVLERQAINEALLLCSGNKSKAAKQLGISRKTFYKRLKEL